ncbi:MAG: glutamine--fructose-6-phosphate aminotransferase, partial [Cyanobacteria bacterium J007]
MRIETIAHLIEDEMKKEKSFEKALRKACSKLEGSYAVVALFSEEKDKLYAMRKESPLLIGIGENENFVASDISAFLKYTKKAVALDDYEYA